MTPKSAFNLAWLALSFVAIEIGLAGHRPEINLSDSLPDLIYLLDVGTPFEKGDLVQFPVPPGVPDPAFNKDFVKKIVGVAGDEVERRDGVVFVGGAEVGRLQETTKQGRPLTPGPIGLIPPGFVFVQGLSERSYDSRYMDVGLIPVGRILGRVRVLL